MYRHIHHFVTAHRFLIVVVSALMVAFVLYPRVNREQKRSGITEILLWTPIEAGDAVRVAVEEFERRNPQYDVLLGTASVRDATADPTRFLLGVAGGAPPDLIHFDRFAVVEWASRGAFADLTPFIEADRDRPDGIRPENFYRPPWQEGSYGGKVYAVPITVDTRALYYSRDALIRAGFVYRKGDPRVVSGDVKAGDARPPKTWEQLCNKLIHADGRVTAEGVVRLDSWTRLATVNEDRPPGSPIDLSANGVRPGDVIVLVSGDEVFRGRIGEVLTADSVRIDLDREQPPGLNAIPGNFTEGVCQVKVFDQDSYAVKLTYYNPQTGQLRTAGFIPLFANSWLFMFTCLNGAELVSADGTTCTMDSPAGIEALQFMTDAYDALGGIKVAQAFTANLFTGPMDPFLVGKVAMRIDSDEYLKLISAYGPDMSFGAAGAPIPQKRLDAGHQSVGWMGGWSYAIPSTARHKRAAWDLMRWLCSVEANQLMARFEASMARAQGQVYFPYSHPDRRIMRWLRKQYIQGSPDITDDMRNAYGVFADLLPVSRYRPVSPIGQLLWSEHNRAMNAAIRHVQPPREALGYSQRRTQAALDDFLNPPTGPRLPWKTLISAYILGVVGLFACFIGYREVRTRSLGLKHRGWLEGYLCASPWLIGFVVLGAGPIIFSLIISFCRYDVLSPAVWIGTDNYIGTLGFHFDETLQRHVPNDPHFWRSLWNTAYMIISVPLVIVVGLALAMLLNTRAKGLAMFRTIFYLPAIVPAVAAFLLWLWVFDPVQGLLNRVLMFLGVTDPPHWLNDPAWAKPALILMGLWAAGGGMIIWLAGLKEIPESLYEAAEIDGANRVQQFTNITLPLLTPYIFFNFLMGMIGVFQTFESAYVMTDGGPADATLFYAYKLFNESFRYLNLGVASAMAWILFVVVLAITLLQMWLSKKWVHYER
jgi:multiple sugar transport system permease protein/multiple sugar transport system substrate-binding protein